MKLRGTKSTQLIRTKQLYEERLNEITQFANNKTHQLMKLKSKITQSKPILETIYNKIKLKEDYLQTELIMTQRKLAQAQQKSNKDSKLNLQTMRMIKDMTLINNNDNHIKTKNNISNTAKQSKKFFQDLTRFREEREKKKNIIEHQNASPPKHIPTQHTYTEYQSRLNKARGSYNVDQSSKDITLKDKLRQVSKELKSGIEIIKKVRQQFKYVDKGLIKSKVSRSQAKIVIKKNKPKHREQEEEEYFINPKNASRFVNNKQKRLDQYRNK